VRIARWAGANDSATESFDKASKLLVQAETAQAAKGERKTIAMASREAVQTAEDARLITLKTQAEARLAAERAAAAGREATANAAAANARADANDAERAAARTRLEASNAAQRAADEARSVAERTRMDASAAALRAAEDARAQAERARATADLVAMRAASDKQAAEAASALAAKNAADQSEREKQELRAKLAGQLSTILQTRDSAKGLVSSMPDVLFDTGQYSLKPAAREVLAKLSGVILAYPSLKLDIGGYTDSVGTDALNQTLSENRANAVRDFLVSQGIARTSIVSQGFGEGQPVATNDTASGRQQNRRVELVVSGEIIGTSSLELR
jgi:outer membrane protein OmpA-like peptidoglycan-associated protein